MYWPGLGRDFLITCVSTQLLPGALATALSGSRLLYPSTRQTSLSPGNHKDNHHQCQPTEGGGGESLRCSTVTWNNVVTLTGRKKCERKRARCPLTDVRSGAALTTCTRVHAGQTLDETDARQVSIADGRSARRCNAAETMKWSLGGPCDWAASRSSRSTRRTVGDAAAPGWLLSCLLACLLLTCSFVWLYSRYHLSRCDGLTGILDEIREMRPNQTRRDETKRDDTKRDEGSDNERERVLG